MANFVYPYNFIRPGIPSKRAPAPSHATFSGLSGTIRCELTTLTPIFTPDPETNTSGAAGDGHRVLTFFKHGNQYMIPGTSLKGMVRSVAETLSNSCWSQFDGSRVRSRRPRPEWWPNKGLHRTPGRIESCEDGDLVIRSMEEAWLPLTLLEGMEREAVDGEAVEVRVVQVAPPQEPARIQCQSLEFGHQGRDGCRQGYAKIVEDLEPEEGEEANHREYQRVFMVPLGGQQSIALPDNIQEIWQDACWGPKRQDPAPLREHDLVWYTQVDGALESIGPVALYKRRPGMDRRSALTNLTRLQVENLAVLSPANAASQAELLQPCRRTHRLCMCCRMFGFVSDSELQEHEARRDLGIAVGGKVSFGFATATGACTSTLRETPLRVLGEPKPKFAPYYLDRTEQPLGDRSGEWENRCAMARGRKFYWHHPDKSTSPSYYRQPNSTKLAPEGRSKFNATVTAIGSEARFTFDVDFWDLSEAELGCLLLSLTLWGDLRHKFGMGKPIGFGSCQITIKSLSIIMDRQQRYRAANLLSAADRAAAGPDEFVDAFRTHMVQEATSIGAPPATTFEQLPQIKDAAIMWHYPALTALDIRYNPDPDGQYRDCGYAYFTDHGGPALRTLEETAAGDGQPG